jgi:hypothetical protein
MSSFVAGSRRPNGTRLNGSGRLKATSSDPSGDAFIGSRCSSIKNRALSVLRQPSLMFLRVKNTQPARKYAAP